MIAPTFHTSILKSFVPVFNKNANRLIASLKKEIGTVFDVHDYLSGTTVDVLLGKCLQYKPHRSKVYRVVFFMQKLQWELRKQTTIIPAMNMQKP